VNEKQYFANQEIDLLIYQLILTEYTSRTEKMGRLVRDG
jgi:hypothetical protein